MKKIIFSAALSLLLGTTGCNKFLDVNENPNQPENVQESLMLRPILYYFANNVHAGWGTIEISHFMQMIAENQSFPNIGTYLFSPNESNDPWGFVYVNCLQNLKLLEEKAITNGNDNYAGIAKIMTAFTLGYATDLWGDIPYSKGLQGTITLKPSYDTQAEIYSTIQRLLDEAIATLEAGNGRTVGAEDFYYNGNTEKWIKAAYTLKARHYIHLIKAPGHNATTQADLALQALEKGFSSNDDDMRLTYPGDAITRNRWFVNFLAYETIVMASQTVDALVERNDPRLPILVAKSNVGDAYRGRSAGAEGIGSLESYSRAGSFYANINAALYLLTYREALFIKAEATLIKNGATAAQPIYQEAIRRDMVKLGVTNTADIDAFIAARGTLTTANALQRIMEEKKIANFLNPENFTDWRRTGYPVLATIPHALSAVPRKLLYPNSELSNNPQPQHNNDILTNRVWWDAP